MDYENMINQQLAAMDLSALDELAHLGRENPLGLTIGSPVQVIRSLFQGELLLDPQNMMESLSAVFLQEIKGSLVFGAEILAVCILSGLLQNLHTNLEESAASRVAVLACSCTIIALSLSNFLSVYRICGTAVDQMTITMQIL
ncbi:MAG: hypothetical protein IJO79_01350, partial [Firmicutes bacterium]|nr:hypothetical protein [Bacillota bacterium]